jgi:hypothetical protein
MKTSTGLALNDGPSVLGERLVRIPTAGKIRPGIQVLTKAAATNKDAVRVYQQGVAAGRSFGEIEVELMKVLGKDAKRPLVPKNVPYFTARRADFAVPEMADRIMQLYGEDRGEGRHLYRLPILFSVDLWQAVLPHALRTYTRSELVYWSEYTPDGVRLCKTRAPLVVDPKSKRATRPFGGRPTTLRPENEGRCVPEKCQEYQDGLCKLSGALIFHIKGIPGASAIELPMTSFYAMQGIRQQLELILHTHGRLKGITFYLAKRQEQVSMLDLESGKPKRVSQWITVLEADVDMTRLLTRSEVEAGADAAAVLEGPADIIDGEIVEPADGTQNPEPQKYSLEDMQTLVTEKVHGFKLKFSDFTPYAANKFGVNWPKDQAALSRILDELNAVEDEEQYRDQVLRGGDDDIPF